MRGAFSLLELVIALVIMAIALLSVPSMLSQMGKAYEVVLHKEAVFFGARSNANLLGYRWDERNILHFDPTKADLNETNITRVYILKTDGDSDLERQSANHRIGSVTRQYHPNGYYATFPLQKEEPNSEPGDDLDDFTNTTESISKVKEEVFFDYTIDTNISYIDDNANYDNRQLSITIDGSPIGHSSNIKFITTTIRYNNDPIVVYHSFACNIGSPTIEERTLQ